MEPTNNLPSIQTTAAAYLARKMEDASATGASDDPANPALSAEEAAEHGMPQDPGPNNNPNDPTGTGVGGPK